MPNAAAIPLRAPCRPAPQAPIRGPCRIRIVSAWSSSVWAVTRWDAPVSLRQLDQEAIAGARGRAPAGRSRAFGPVQARIRWASPAAAASARPSRLLGSLGAQAVIDGGDRIFRGPAAGSSAREGASGAIESGPPETAAIMPPARSSSGEKAIERRSVERRGEPVRGRRNAGPLRRSGRASVRARSPAGCRRRPADICGRVRQTPRRRDRGRRGR